MVLYLPILEISSLLDQEHSNLRFSQRHFGQTSLAQNYGYLKFLMSFSKFCLVIWITKSAIRGFVLRLPRTWLPEYLATPLHKLILQVYTVGVIKDDFRVLEGSFYQRDWDFCFILVYFMASFMFRSSAFKRFTNRSSTANRLFRFASTYWDTIPNMCVCLLFSLFNSKVNCHVNGSGISILF